MLWTAAVLIAVILILIYKLISWNNDYWNKRNIPHQKPRFFFGSIKEQIMGTKHLAEIYQDIYNSFDDKVRYIGFWSLTKPSIMLRDPDLIKDVLTTYFTNFAYNELEADPSIDPIMAYNPFLQRGEAWKRSRGHFVPSVTNSKVKLYFVGMEEICNEMVKYIRSLEDENGVVELESKVLAGKYTTDVTAKAIFGVENNSFENENSMFHQMTSTIFSTSLWENFKVFVIILFPKLNKILKIRLISKSTEDRVIRLTKEILAHRQETGIKRNDFFQNMITYKENDTINEFTNEYIASHSFGFIGDGYETSSTTIAFTLYELAWHQDLQDKLRNEISEAMKETDGKLSYDHIQAMKYLDMVVSETLRLHPPGVIMTRLCSKQHVFPPAIPGGEPLTVDVNNTVAIPIYALHMDPKYYPEPERFDPERFSDEAIAARHKFVYLPFGEGPRICLGIRYAMAQTKAAIASILFNFKVKPSLKSPYPVLIDPHILILRPLNGAWIEFHDLNK